MFGLFAIIILAVIFISNDNEVSGIEATMYKSPTCGCCIGHSSYLNGKGFDVDVVPTYDMVSIKNEYAIPSGMESCHTTIIGDYFVEGHVPIEAINKLLEEQPDIDGIALPNMPSGSPGMPGSKTWEWIIYSIKDGKTSEFMRV